MKIYVHRINLGSLRKYLGVMKYGAKHYPPGGRGPLDSLGPPPVCIPGPPFDLQYLSLNLSK